MKKKLIAIVLVIVLMCLQSFESIAITVQDMIIEEEVFTELLKGDFEEDSVMGDKGTVLLSPNPLSILSPLLSSGFF